MSHQSGATSGSVTATASEPSGFAAIIWMCSVNALAKPSARRRKSNRLPSRENVAAKSFVGPPTTSFVEPVRLSRR